jgi:hypothetical protein
VKSAALSYAARGWRVIPLHDMSAGVCSCRKGADCATPGKHPRLSKWPEAASRDPGLIGGWWSGSPTANVGVVTGIESRLLVLDVDPRSGGYESLAAFLPIPPTPTVSTGGGGRHYYLRHPGDKKIQGRVLADGLELKADGQFVVAPPSQTGDQGGGDRPPHAWSEHRDLEPAPAMEKVLAARLAVQSTSSSEWIPCGKRHIKLAQMAGAMRRHGATGNEIAVALLTVFHDRCEQDGKMTDADVADLAYDTARRYPDHDPVQAALGQEAERLLRLMHDGEAPAATSAPASSRPRPVDGDDSAFQFEPVNWDAVKAGGIPRLDYLDEPFLPSRKRIWAAGPTESGKSIWAAYKTRQITLRGGLVIYVSQENGLEEEARRFLRLRPNFDLLHLYVDQGLDLTDSGHRDALFAASEGAALVVLDTYSACWEGDEDSNREFAAFDRDVMQPIKASGSSLLVLDHTGNPQQHGRRHGAHAPRGASSKGQKADFLLEFRTVGDDGLPGQPCEEARHPRQGGAALHRH